MLNRYIRISGRFLLKMQKRYGFVWWFVKICIILPPFFKFM